MDSKQITEAEMLAHFREGEAALAPLIVRKAVRDYPVRSMRPIDLYLELSIVPESEPFRFVLESKSRSTPEAVHSAVTKVLSAALGDLWPMIQVPYLSPERLEELEKLNVSGIDLCGNGIVIVPGRLYVLRSGKPNQYRDSRPLNNPYSGHSAMVGRMLITNPKWDSLNELKQAIEESGLKISLGQVSKAVQALKEDRIVQKDAGSITLADPIRLLENLRTEWPKHPIRNRLSLRLPPGDNWARKLSSESALQWAITGESSVTRYAMFAQGGPRSIAVTNIPLAIKLLQGKPEPVPNFADINLLETSAPGYYFGNEIDEQGARWASKLQTWLELESGDARQQDAAKNLRFQLLEETRR